MLQEVVFISLNLIKGLTLWGNSPTIVLMLDYPIYVRRKNYISREKTKYIIKRSKKLANGKYNYYRDARI